MITIPRTINVASKLNLTFFFYFRFFKFGFFRHHFSWKCQTLRFNSYNIGVQQTKSCNTSMSKTVYEKLYLHRYGKFMSRISSKFEFTTVETKWLFVRDFFNLLEKSTPSISPLRLQNLNWLEHHCQDRKKQYRTETSLSSNVCVDQARVKNKFDATRSLIKINSVQYLFVFVFIIFFVNHGVVNIKRTIIKTFPIQGQVYNNEYKFRPSHNKRIRQCIKILIEAQLELKRKKEMGTNLQLIVVFWVTLLSFFLIVFICLFYQRLKIIAWQCKRQQIEHTCIWRTRSDVAELHC